MRTEELFTKGVMPKETLVEKGKVKAKKGERLMVVSISQNEFCVHRPDDGETFNVMASDVEIWREPTTIFEDHSCPVTWGALKEAAEKKGLPDSTQIYLSWMLGPSQASVRLVHIDDPDDKFAILVY